MSIVVNRRTARSVLSLGILALLSSGLSRAVPTLTLTQGASTVTITDGSPGDLNPAAGAITFIGSVGVFSVNVSTGITKPVIGTAAVPALSLNSTDTSTAGGILNVNFTEDGFTANPFQAALSASSTDLVGTGSATFQALLNGVNYGPAFGFTSPGGAGATIGPAVVPPLTPYTLSLTSHITHSGNATTIIGFQLTAVPEPGFYGLLALGLSGLGFGVFRKRNPQV